MSNTIGQTAPKPRDSIRYRMLVAGILSLAAAITCGLAWQNWHTALLQRRSTEHVLADYASFAASSYQDRVRSKMFMSANPVFAGADGVAQQPDPVLSGVTAAADSIDRCRCLTSLSPRFMFIVDLHSGRSYYRRRDSTVTDAAIESRLNEITRALSASLARSGVRDGYGKLPYRIVAEGHGSDSWVAVYAARFRNADDPGVVLGMETSAAAFARSILEPSFSGGALLPQSLTRGAPSERLLSVEVRNSNEDGVFSTNPAYPRSFSASESVGGPDSALVATFSMNPAVASTLVIGGLPPSPARTVLPFIALAVALLALAYFIVARREIDSLEVRASLSEARLAALRSQIQPHFLFNVLNTIAMLARKGDTKAVLNSLSQLADLLRKVLAEPSGNETTLGEEMSFIRQYLALEHARFGDRLRFNIDLPAELSDAVVPSLILQPVVENALIHGVAKSRNPITLSIAASASESVLHLDVIDDGPGMNGNLLATSSGIGLRNCRDRLQHLYGAAASLEVRNRELGGVAALVCIPLRTGAPAPQNGRSVTGDPGEVVDARAARSGEKQPEQNHQA